MRRGLTSVLLCAAFLASAFAFSDVNVSADSGDAHHVGAVVIEDSELSQLGADGDPPVQPWTPKQSYRALYPTEWELCNAPSGVEIHVPKEAYTIQQAVNQVKEDGMIIVGKGLYRENLRIPSYKQIVLRGSGEPNETRITALNRYLPTVSVSGGGSVCMESLRVEGGHVAIAAGERNGSVLGPRARGLVLRQVEVVEATHGIIANSDSIYVRQGRIADNLGWGGVLVGPRVVVTLSRISENRAGGVVVLSGGLCDGADDFDPDIGVIWGNVIANNDGPGLIVCRGDVSVFLNTLIGNQMAGIYVFGADDPVNIVNNVITATTGVDPGDGTLRWGDGIVVIDSPTVRIMGNFIIDNYRAGVYYSDSGGLISGNVIMFNVFAIALENGADPDIPFNVAMFNERNDVAVGLGLDPAPPLEPLQ